MREFVTLKALFVPVSECLINEQPVPLKEPAVDFRISPSSLLMGSSSSPPPSSSPTPSPRPLCHSREHVCIFRLLIYSLGVGGSRERTTQRAAPQHF